MIDLEYYKTMLLINTFENKLVSEYDKNQIKTPIHLSVGQEAIAVGVCSQLKDSDKIISTHRSHAHYIAKGGDLSEMIDELYGKRTGCAGGRGGSMHLIDNKVGVLGSTSIVGGSIPMATGVALQQSLFEDDTITVCFFGDGAAEEGVFHESLNFAALKNLPVVYVCENNNFAVFTPEEKRKKLTNIYQWGEKFGIEGFLVDGNNVEEVAEITKKAVEKARKRVGPTIVEARSFLKYSHVGNKTDIHLGHKDVDIYKKFMANSPLNLTLSKLLKNSSITQQENDRLVKNTQKLIDDLFAESLQKEDVCKETLFDNLYHK